MYFMFIKLFLYSRQIIKLTTLLCSPWDLPVLAWLLVLLLLLCRLELPWVRGLLGLLELLELELLLPCPADLLERPVLLAEELQALPGLLQVQALPDLGLAGRAGLLCLLAAGLARLLITKFGQKVLEISTSLVHLLVLQVQPGPADLHGRQERADHDLSEAADLLVLQLAGRLDLHGLLADQQGLLYPLVDQVELLPVQQVGLQGLLGLPVVVGQKVPQADLVPWEPPDLLALQRDLHALPGLVEAGLAQQVADLGLLAELAGQL